MSCVNKSSKEFKAMAANNNVDSNTLELIIHKYWLQTGSEDNFPTDVYVQAQLGNYQYEESIPEAKELWLKRYRYPRTYTSYAEVQTAYKQAITCFPKHAVSYHKDAKGNYVLTVKEPVKKIVRTAKNFFEKNQGRTLDLGIKEGEVYTIDKAESLFSRLKQDRTSHLLATKVFNVAKELGLQITFNDTLPAGKAGRYTEGNTITFNKAFFEKDSNNDKKVPILLHEVIHALTSHALSEQTTNWAKPESVEKFRTEVNDIFSKVRYHEALKGEHGVQDIHEFVAELANPIFRKKLQSIDNRKWYTKIVDAIKSLLGIHTSSTYYNRMMNTLNDALESFDVDYYLQYNNLKPQLQQFYNDHKVEFENMSETEIKDTLHQVLPQTSKLLSFIDSMSKDQLIAELKQIKQEYHDYDLVTDRQKQEAKKGTFTFEDGVSVKVPFTPNDQQAEALNVMNDFIHSNETSMTLSGYAGTGKTSLMEIIAQKARRDGKNIIFCATTNKAASVLGSKVSKQGFSASTLNKIFGIGVEVDTSKAYDAKNLVNTLHDSDVILGSTVIIDEASMINEANYKILNKVAKTNHLKLIYVGDRAQLAPVGEDKVSIVFRNTDGKVLELTKVERTDDNAILKEATNIRNGKSMSMQSSFNEEGKGVAFLNPDGEHRQQIVDTINHLIPGLKKDANYFRILAFTNAAVESYNNYVRKKLGYGTIPEKGEPIMGYSNWGYNWRTKTYKFINSESYKVIKTESSRTKSIKIGNHNVQMLVTPITLEDSMGNQNTIDFMDIKGNEANKQAAILLATMKKTLWEQARRASMARKKDIYSQINEIDKFLFVNDNIIDENGHYLQAKTFDYGYALTIHKSQGSTFTHVLLDAKNIEKAKSMRNSINDALPSVDSGIETYNNPEEAVLSGIPEEVDLGIDSFDTPTETLDQKIPQTSDIANMHQQLEYVGMSRATDTVTVITPKAQKEDSILNHLREKGADKPIVETQRPVVPVVEKTQPAETVDYQPTKESPEHWQLNYYEGDITPDAHTVFVFGSNPEGRHGAGAAKVAKDRFGAQYGVGEGLTGNAYALPTKDLRVKENNSLRSISEDKIVKSIKGLYEVARQNPNKQFKIAYRNTDRASLNGYTGLEMIDMFLKAGEIPSNIAFSKEWVDTGKFDSLIPSTNEPQSSRTEEQKIIANQLVDHMKSMGLNVKGTADMQKYLAEHPNTLLQEAIFGIDAKYLNNRYLSVIPDIQAIIENNKYNKAGTDIVIIEGDNNIYLVDHSTNEEYKVHRREGRHGVGIRKVFDSTKLTTEDVKEIIRNIAADYSYSEKRIKHVLQTLGLKAEHLSGIDFNAELKGLATGNATLHGNKGRGEGAGYNGPRGYNYNGSKQGSRDARSLGQNTEEQALVTSRGEVFGFVDKEGNIYLDETKISPEHPIHEYTHLWDRVLAKHNPELWQRGVDLMRQTDLWHEGLHDANYGKLWQDKGVAGDKLTSLIASEVHSRLVGKEGSEILERLAKKEGNSGIIAKLKQWILEAWQGLKDTFSYWSGSEIETLTLKDFNRMTVRDFTEGINPLAPKTIELSNYELFKNLDHEVEVDFAWKIPMLKELDAELSENNDQNTNDEIINKMNDILQATTEDDLKEVSAKKKAEIQKDLEAYENINQQVDNLLEGKFSKKVQEEQGVGSLKELDVKLSATEVRKVAELIGNYISDMITRLQTDKDALAELFPLLKFKKEDSDFTIKSRREIVETLGIQNLINRAKFDFAPENEVLDYEDTDVILKAILIGENWDALMLMASDIFHLNEGFGIARDHVNNKFDINKSEEHQIAFDDFNGFQDEDSINETEGDAQEHWQIETKTIDVLNSMSELVRMGIHECYILDKNGNKVIDEDWRLPLRVNPRKVTNSILRWTQGALTLEDMVTKLQGKQADNPWLSQLITRLSDKTGKETDFQSQFFGVFMKPFQLYNIVQMENGKYVSMPVNSHPALSEAVNSITAQFRMGEHPLFNADGKVNSKLLGTEKTIADSQEFNLHQALSHLQVIRDRINKDGEEFSAEISQEATKWLAGTYRILGYNVTEEMVMDVLNQDNLKDLTSKLGFIVKDLDSELETQKNNAGRKYDPFKYGAENNIGGSLRNFLKPVTDTLEDVAVSAFYDSGKMYQSYVTPSFMTKLMQKFKLTGTAFEDFIMNEYGNSEWFRDQKHWGINKGWRNEMIRLLATKPEAREIFDFKVELNFNKHSYMRNMSDSEYTLSLIAEYFAEGWKNKEANVSWFRMPMQSNKPSSEFYKFYSYRGSNVDYKSIITRQLYNMFLQELSRIQTVNMRDMTKEDSEFMKNFDTNGKKFNFLPFLNGYLKEGNKADRNLLRNEDNTVSSDNERLANLLQRKLEGLEENKLSADEEAALMNLVSKAIRNHMERRIAEILDSWEKSGIVEGARNIKDIVKDKEFLNEDLKEDDPNRNQYVKESLENFLWNDYLASKNILQLTIGDISFYKDAEDLQKRLAQLHAPGIRANVAATDYEGKRVSDGTYRTVILKDWNNFISNIIDNIAEVFDRKIAATPENQKAQMEALKESLVGKNGAYRKINVADAQGFSSPSSYRKKAFMFGKWSKDAESLYQDLKENYKKIINGEYTYTDLKNAFQPLKPFVYSHLQKNLGVEDAPIHTMPVPFQAKNSEYLLIMADAILKGDEAAGNTLSRPNLLKALYRVMEESEQLNPTKGIDTIQFESAIKSGLQGAIDLHQFADMPGGEKAAYTFLMDNIYKSVDGKRISEYNTDVFVHEASYEDYCLQQEVPPHFQNHSQAHGSQIRMIVPSDLDFYIDANGDHNDPNNINYYEWTEPDGTKRKVNAKEFRKEYEETIAQNIEEDITSLEQELHLNATDKRERNIALSKILQREILSSPRYGIDLLQACSVDKTTGEFRIPKGDPIQAKRIEQLINSIIKNRINKQKIAGGPIVQVSSYGTSKRLNIRFKDKNGRLLMTRQEYEKNPIKKTSQVDKFNAKYKGVTSESTVSYEEYVKENQAGIAHYEVFAPIWAKELVEKFADENGNIDMEALENASPELTEMISYRIPSEDKYSIAPSKVVGFMPREAGDAVMFPYDLTTIDDSDFDVDKRYFMRKDIPIILKNNSDIIKLMYDRISKEYAAAHDGKVNEKFLKEQIRTFVANPERMLKANKGKTHEQLRKWTNYLASHYRKVAYTTAPPTKGKTYRNNKIINMTLAVLTNEKSADKMLNPGGFEDVARTGYMIAAYKSPQVMNGEISWERLQSMTEDELKDLSYTSKDLGWADTQIQFYKQNSSTSSMIGIFAVSKVAHAVLEGNGIYIDINEIAGEPFTIAGMTFGDSMEIDVRYDTDGNLVGKTAGSLVSASADGVKKPVLDLMNVNTATAGILNTMLRLGMSFRKAALFMSQDVIGRLLKEFNRRNLSDYVTLKDLTKECLSAYEKQHSITEGSTIKSEELSEEELIEGIRPSEHEATDYKVLLAFQKLSDINEAMRNPTFATRFNSISSAVGPLIVDNLIMEHKMEQFGDGLSGSDEAGTHFYDSPSVEDRIEVDINDIFAEHPILKQFSRTVALAKDMFKDMPAGSQQFRNILKSEDMPEFIQNRLFGDRKLLSQFSDFFQSYALVASGLINPSEIKYYVEQFPKEFIKENYTEKYPDNALIKAIKPSGNKKSKYTFLEVKTTGMDTQQKEELSNAWIDLHQEDPELSQKLFIYNFFRAGIGFSPKTFMSLVPMYVKEHLSLNGTTYVDTFRNLPEVVSRFIIDQFIRNNWNNNKLVPWKGNKNNHFRVDYKHGILDITNPTDIESIGGATYFKTKGRGRNTYLWKQTYKSDDHLQYKLVEPLGNNGEYLEISNSDLSEVLSKTTETVEDNAPAELKEQSPAEDITSETIPVKESPGQTAYKMSELVNLVWNQVRKFHPEITIEQAQEKVDKMKVNPKQYAGFIATVLAQKGLTLNKEEAIAEFKKYC